MSAHPSPMSTKRERFAWCMYDFSNSAFPTIIITAVYVLYFKNVVVGNAETGRSDNLWGLANSIGAAIVFATAPLLGAVADVKHVKRVLMIGFALLCIAATFFLSFTKEGTIMLAIILVIAGVIGFEGSLIFYNAFLPDLVPPAEMGRLSGKGWALGYLGGLGCLLTVLPLAKAHLQLIPLVVAAWYLVFSLPALLWLRDRKEDLHEPGWLAAFASGFKRVTETIRAVGKHRPLMRFLGAYFFFNNAVVTIIVFAVAFSAQTLHFTTVENILLIVAMNVIASPGALAFGVLTDKWGAKTTLIIVLVMWLIVVAGAELAAWPGVFSPSGAKLFFWFVAGLASLAIGAVQASSTAFVGQLTPRDQSGQFYGLMTFAGRGSAIVGPLVFGLASDLFDSQRVAVATIGAFFLIGLILLFRVPANSNILAK